MPVFECAVSFACVRKHSCHVGSAGLLCPKGDGPDLVLLFHRDHFHNIGIPDFGRHVLIAVLALGHIDAVGPRGEQQQHKCDGADTDARKGDHKQILFQVCSLHGGGLSSDWSGSADKRDTAGAVLQPRRMFWFVQEADLARYSSSVSPLSMISSAIAGLSI